MHERVKAALGAVMAEVGVLDVVRGRAGALRLGGDGVARDVEELRVLVDEPLDEPRTCDAIDPGVLASDPACHLVRC